MSGIDYEEKAANWYEAWNSRDAQNICDLYADDLVFSSPFIRKLGLSEDGALTDIQAFYTYVSRMLPRIPNLKYEPVANCLSVEGHTLVYRNQSSHIVTENLEYDDQGLIRRVAVAFSTAPIKRKNYGSR